MRRERRHRGALHRHPLDLRQGRDDGRGHIVALGREALGDLPVQPLAPVDHGEEREHPRPLAVEAGQEVGELVQGAQRQHRRDQRDDQGVGGLQDALRQQRDTWGAVEENDVVLIAERGEEPGDPPGRLLGGPEDQVQVPVGEVGGEQVEIREVGPLDRVIDLPAALDQRLAAALDPRPDPEQEAGGGLRVQIPEQHPQPILGGQVAQVDRGRGLPDTALDVVGGQYFHRPAPRSWRAPFWLARSGQHSPGHYGPGHYGPGQHWRSGPGTCARWPGWRIHRTGRRTGPGPAAGRGRSRQPVRPWRGRRWRAPG